MIVYGLTLYFAFILLKTMVTKKRIETSEKTSKSDYYSETDDHYIFEKGLRIGFTATVQDSIVELYKDNGYFWYYIAANYYDGYNYHALNLSECNPSDIEEFVKYNQTFKFWCLNETENLFLRSNRFSSNYQSIKFNMKLIECDKCPNKTEVINRPDFQIRIYHFVINPYIDFSDINTPLKTSLEDKYLGYVVGPYALRQTMYIRKNSYTLYDSYLFSPPAEGEFYSLNHLQSDLLIMIDDDSYTLTIALDNEMVSYERRVYGLFDVISDIGGFYGIIKALTVLFMSNFTSKLYNFYTVNKFNKMMSHYVSFKTSKKYESRSDGNRSLNLRKTQHIYKDKSVEDDQI